MLRRLREQARAKLGRLLQDYVVADLRGLADDRAAEVSRLSAELTAARQDVTAVRQDLAAAREELRGAEERLQSSLRAWERRQRRDLFTVTDIGAAQSSAAFLRREMDRAVAYFDKRDTLAAALKAAPASGLYLEFGVATGGTLRQITGHAPAGSVFGFDSFEGLPEHWRSGFPAGAFATDGLPDVPGAELVVGWFDRTLPAFLAEHPGRVAFLHVDADLYSSTVTVLDLLEPRLQEGTVVLFDEYFNYPGWEEHEHRAWTEFVARTGLAFEYLGFTADDEQIAVRITRR
jgi:hypothetical protein